MDDETAAKMNETMGSEGYWSSTGDNATIKEVFLQKKGESYRRVTVGINIEYECKNSQCKLAGKKAVKNVGIGMCDLVDCEKLQCGQCKTNENT